MELVKRKENCCGCRTCEKVCPKQAIQMKPDVGGFLYPVIDSEKCIDCGLCLKKCAFQSGYKKRKEFEPFYGYGARHLSEEEYKKSRSGAAFAALSDRILEENGVIYGAGFDEEQGFFYVKHKAAVTAEQRDEFRGSKYVQSDLNDVFPRIKEDLEAGKTVLFSGTGCQVGALYSYLPKEYENLYSVDIVCHGTPAPAIWADFLHMREEEYKGSITNVDFRDKLKYGWTAHRETISIDGKPVSSRIFGSIFSQGVSYRPSCFECVYANKNRPGDITIADFWGHEKALGEKWDDDMGISLCLVNNAHGMELWEKARVDMEWIDCTGYPFRHTNMKHPTARPEKYDEFWKDYEEQGFPYVVGKYTKHTYGVIPAPKKKADAAKASEADSSRQEAKTADTSGKKQEKEKPSLFARAKRKLKKLTK